MQSVCTGDWVHRRSNIETPGVFCNHLFSITRKRKYNSYASKKDLCKHPIYPYSFFFSQLLRESLRVYHARIYPKRSA